MKNVFRRMFSLILAVCLLMSVTASVFAAGEEEYLCELRLIYAADYNEAKEILEDSEFEDYKILKENLNADTKKIGVWLAYKTTTDIEDAITDISVIQMDGGYNEGNYQEMIEQSFNEYVEIGEVYRKAIEYFVEAYDEGHFLAECAYRQLNFYTSITDEDLGIEIPDFDGEPLGDVFYDGLEAEELAVMFMEGNSYVLNNIRSLLAMGVSYNEDGMHYLEKVAEAAAEMNEDPSVFEDEETEKLADLIVGSVMTFRSMFEELAGYEDEMDYYDDETTELEIKYAEYKSFADRMREVEYLDGQTLYDFCLNYEYDGSDLTNLYPLAAALNEGQQAITEMAHYYDVVRYSMSDYPEDMMDEQISEMEEFYCEYPFNIYTGVDRSIYYGTFALTSEAYRADAYTEDGFMNHVLNDKLGYAISGLTTFAVGTGLGIWAVRRTIAAKKANVAFEAAKEEALQATLQMRESVTEATNQWIAHQSNSVLGLAGNYGSTYSDFINAMVAKVYPTLANTPRFAQLTYAQKIYMVKSSNNTFLLSRAELDALNTIDDQINQFTISAKRSAMDAHAEAQAMTQATSKLASAGTIALYIVGGAMLVYSAISLTYTVYSYYNPEYDDIPIAMVDLIETVDGDRYIKYDAVMEVEAQKDGVYAAGDLNAFKGQRWNAMYYTKSYEAGKPLLADEFNISSTNNTPKDNYAPVHRFGEVVCYDLNKYTFNDDTSVYLSVKQSKNQKAAVADVPEIVGSIFSAEFLFIAGGLGAAAGVGGTLSTQSLLKKKRVR